MKRTSHRLVPAANEELQFVNKDDIVISSTSRSVSLKEIDIDKECAYVDRRESLVNNIDVGQERY